MVSVTAEDCEAVQSICYSHKATFVSWASYFFIEVDPTYPALLEVFTRHPCRHRGLHMDQE
jgi:hypothetical protein